MRVTLQPQVVNQNYVQQKQKPFTTAPLMTDSVSFSGKKKVAEAFTQELINKFSKDKKPFSYIECYSMEHSAKTRLELFHGEEYYLEKEIKPRSLFSFFKRKPRYNYSITETNSDRRIKLNPDEFRLFQKGLRKIAERKILKNQSYSTKTFLEFLNNIESELISIKNGQTKNKNIIGIEKGKIIEFHGGKSVVLHSKEAVDTYSLDFFDEKNYVKNSINLSNYSEKYQFLKIIKLLSEMSNKN